MGANSHVRKMMWEIDAKVILSDELHKLPDHILAEFREFVPDSI
jgi:hypothetical protein